MINSAEKFRALRTSENRNDYSRAANEPAPDGVWTDVIEKFPDMRVWVAQNKTISIDILRVLA